MKNIQKPAILVVDDSRTNLMVLSEILKSLSFRVITASNGLEALNLVKKEEPDLILLDIVMPDMDGFEVCKILKNHSTHKKIPVIFLTAMNDKEYIIKGFKLGGVDYIVKPFIEEEVIARINVHLELQQTLEKMEQMAITDELTGVYNRRYAYQILEDLVSLAQQAGNKFILCYIDIDNLKELNDRFNHSAGDRLIKTVIMNLKKKLPPEDYIFRMGGDEFLLFLYSNNPENSKHTIIDLRKKLNRVQLLGYNIDFSYGFAESDTTMTSSINELILLADTEMYRQKKEKKLQAQKEKVDKIKP